MHEPFRAGISAGFLRQGIETLLAPEALALLDRNGIAHEFFECPDGVVRAEEIADYDAVVLLGEQFGPAAMGEQNRLVGVARWGVGYDAVDLTACTAHDICVFITPNGVRRPVALANLTLLLAMTMRLRAKDALVREGAWARKAAHMGEMLTGKTLGSLGLGNIGRELFRLAAPLGMRHIAHDPYLTPVQAEATGVALVEKEALLRQSDVLTINCALTPETHHAIGAAELALMRPSAYLINAARGPIVDQAALVAALREGRLRGAGLDVFEQEPLPLDSPLLALENVWLAPHALGWTEELRLNLSLEDAQGLVRLAHGDLPDAIVNADVVARPGFQAKLRAFRDGTRP